MTAARATTRTRIGVLGLVFAGALAVVLLCLWLLMVHDQDVWLRRSNENRWSFRSVPSQRGVLRDRLGRVLANDQPTTRLTVHYERFRLRHAVGAAVHAATTWARQQPGGEGTTYDYLDGVLGPLAAVNDLFAVPARELRGGALDKKTAAELAYTTTTVLAGCSGLPRSRVFTALREAARGGGGLAVGDVLPVPRHELLVAFRRMVASLQQLDHDVAAERAARAERLGLPAGDVPALLGTLEFLRRASLAGQRVTWVENGETRQGSKLESVQRTFAEHVPFDLAAELRVAGTDHPGIHVSPAVARVLTVTDGTALRALVGNVVEIDRALPAPSWLARFVDRELPDDWLDELVPEGVVASADAREQWQEDAKDRYERELRRCERRGTTGAEAAFDDELTGRLGIRFAEHDSRRREQRLWSHLRVEPGEDVQLTIDVDLQAVAERATAAAAVRMTTLHDEERDRVKVEAALAVIDAHSGDVLAYAGSPIVSALARDVPGVWWTGNGALGSVVKPFVLVEQLQSERDGRPLLPIAAFAPCEHRFPFADQVLKCSGHHGAGGRDPVEALADSCNVFYYQAGIGLGNDGIARALRRFGLLEAQAGDPFAACWQPSVRGLAVAPPTFDGRTLIPQRAVGYGVAASPLHVARAYAACATGALPELGMTMTPRTRVLLDDVIAEIGLVQQGLRACVQNGTARRLPLLRDLDVCGKTGTAEVGLQDQNNAWFAGYAPAAASGVQLTFCAVVYWVRDRVHGGEAAGELVSEFLAAVQADAALYERYLAGAGGR